MRQTIVAAAVSPTKGMTAAQSAISSTQRHVQAGDDQGKKVKVTEPIAMRIGSMPISITRPIGP